MCDMARSGLSQCSEPLFGENRFGEPPVHRIGLAPHQSSLLESCDHARQPRHDALVTSASELSRIVCCALSESMAIT